MKSTGYECFSHCGFVFSILRNNAAVQQAVNFILRNAHCAMRKGQFSFAMLHLMRRLKNLLADMQAR
jgi:hypothetical protein